MLDICWTLFNQFSHPRISADETFYASVAEAHANIAIEEILRDDSRHCIQNNQLFENLSGWLARTKPLRNIWFASIGKLGNSRSGSERAELSDLLGRACLDLGDQFDDFSAQFAMISHTPLVFRRYLARPSQSLVVTRIGQELCVRMGEGRHTGLCRYHIHTGLVSANTIQVRLLGGTDNFKIIQTNQSANQIVSSSKYGLPLEWSEIGDFNREKVVVDGIVLLN
jgi:hypothetical protein